MFTGRLNLIIVALVAIVAVLSIAYNYKLLYTFQLNKSSQLAYDLAHQVVGQNRTEKGPAFAEVARQLEILDLPHFLHLRDGEGMLKSSGSLSLPESIQEALLLRGLPERFDRGRWVVFAIPFNDNQQLLYGFNRSDVVRQTLPVLLQTILFVVVALGIYIAAIRFYLRSRLEVPLDQLLKKRLRALVGAIISGRDDGSLLEPIEHLPRPLAGSIHSIFAVLISWSRYKRHFEEFMALSVSETDKQALCQNLYMATKGDFFIRSMLVLESNHSASRLEPIFCSDQAFVTPEAFLNDPNACLVYRTGSKVIQSSKRSFCDLCGTLDEDEAVLCKPLIAGAVQQGICRMIIDRRALGSQAVIGEGLEDRMQFVETHLKSYLDFVALSLVSISLQNAYRNQALTDELTGLYNRRYIVEYFENMLNIAKRKESPVAVMMIDIDNFKRFNDEYGHKVGDQVLKLVGSALLQNVREGDAVGRYGGEEFIVIFPHTEIEDALQVAERIRKAVASMQWGDFGLGALPRITISAGMAHFPQHGYSHYHLTNAADRALYRAKREGKNRVVVHSPLKERSDDEPI